MKVIKPNKPQKYNDSINPIIITKYQTTVFPKAKIEFKDSDAYLLLRTLDIHSHEWNLVAAW